jgi:hypothetical protein
MLSPQGLLYNNAGDARVGAVGTDDSRERLTRALNAPIEDMTARSGVAAL